MKKILFFLFLGTSLLCAKPTIYMLATGGTIAGTAKSSVDGGYSSGALTIDAILEAVPQVNDIADIKGEQVANIGSHHMNNEVWLKLAKKVNALLSNKDVDGIVITHGTDSIEETGYFLNLVVKSDKPVVMVGAMRAATSISADGPLNIYNAVNVAINKDSVGKGVLLVMNDEIHCAREVTKTNTTNVSTFKSPNFGKIGIVNFGEVEYYMQPLRKHTKKSVFNVEELEELPKVDILYSHTQDNGNLVKASVESGAKGIVVAGMGNGSLFPDVEKALVEAQKRGVIIVRTSRTGTGTTSVGTGVKLYDKPYGFIAGDTLNPQKARILLMIALTKTDDKEQIRKFFKEY